MSKELDAKIDAARERLIIQASTPISYSNYKQQLRAYQELFLGVINVLDDLNEEISKELDEEEKK